MVTNNQKEQRFELSEEGKLVIADYTQADGVLSILHVEADPALRGKGSAGRLMEGIVAYADEYDIKLQPVCSYAVTWLQRHSKWPDVV